MKTDNRSRIRIIRIALGSMICLAATASLAAQDATPSVRNFREEKISPDGTRVAWVESLTTAGRGSAIYVQDIESPGSQPRRVSAATEGSTAHEEDVSWSPDGKQLAFLSDVAGDSQSELYVADLDGGAPRKLTSLKGFLADPGWSPDGKTLAILFTENAPRAAGPLMPMTPETGVVDNKIFEQRLTVVEVASGSVRQLSPDDMYVYEYSWSPDSKNFSLIAAHGAGDSNWYVAQIYRLSLGEGALQAVYKPHWQIAVPRWSPDGKSIAFIEGLMSDEGSTGGDIFVVPANGGSARNVTPGIAASPNAIFWSAPDKILFTENIDGQSGISTVNLKTGKVDQLWSGPEALTASFSTDRANSAAIRSSPAHPAEIWVGSIGNWKQLTRFNDSVRPDWGEMKSLHWTSDRMRVQGWLLYPKDYDPSRR